MGGQGGEPMNSGERSSGQLEIGYCFIKAGNGPCIQMEETLEARTQRESLVPTLGAPGKAPCWARSCDRPVASAPDQAQLLGFAPGPAFQLVRALGGSAHL